MPNGNTSTHTIVVGAGHSGLAMSRCLQREGISHVVLERSRVGASWRTRWDSFHLNTPSDVNILPDGEMKGDAGDFLSRDQWVEAMEAYRAKFDLPVRTGVEVRAIERGDGGYVVKTGDEELTCRCVVLCTGDQNVPRTPAGLASQLPRDIEQLHGSEFLASSRLPDGGVLVVGSGQTGGQIVEDLLEAGRDVWLCTSRVGRVPRRYRGRDFIAWAKALGMTEHRTGDVPAEERGAAQPMISGTHGGHSLSLHLLGRSGARLLGRLQGIEGRVLQISDDLMVNVAHGDQVSAKLRAGLDAFIQKTGLDVPPAEPDPADAPCEELEEMAAVRTLNLDETGIRSVIWATGFGGDFGYLPAELVGADGLPKHESGVCIAPGLFCLGLIWLRTRISGIIPGAAGDAESIVSQIKGTGT